MTKLVKFCVSTPTGSFERLGLVIDDKYVDLNLAYAAYLANEVKEDVPYRLASIWAPADLQEWIEGGNKSIEAAKEAAKYVRDENLQVTGPQCEQIVYDPKEVKLLPPLPSLKVRMFAMARNFHGHVDDAAIPKRPAGFLKNTYAVIADGDDILYPDIIQKDQTSGLNIECELVAYIGKKGKDISKEEAMDYIIGYTMGNDVTAREQQAVDVEDRRYIYPAKNADTLAPLGPYIVLKDEIPDTDVYKLAMSSKVNGRPYQKAVMDQMVHKYADTIAYFSRDYTLYPGDMFWSGSVAYIDRSLGPLKVGDVVECEIERVGKLINKVVQKHS